MKPNGLPKSAEHQRQLKNYGKDGEATTDATERELRLAGRTIDDSSLVAGYGISLLRFHGNASESRGRSFGNIEIVTLDGQNQVPKQTADLEAVVAEEYDGVLVSPITADAMAPAVQQVMDAGIPVVTIDRSVTGVEVLAHVGADNVLGGEQQGQAILDLFPDGATIFELEGDPGSSPAIDRGKGLKNIIGGVANIQVACKQTAEFRRDKGLSMTENCLGATPDPDAIVAANDDMAFGAIEAAKAAGFTVCSSSATMPCLRHCKPSRRGDLYGTVEQFPGEQSKTCFAHPG